MFNRRINLKTIPPYPPKKGRIDLPQVIPIFIRKQFGFHPQSYPQDECNVHRREGSKQAMSPKPKFLLPLDGSNIADDRLNFPGIGSLDFSHLLHYKVDFMKKNLEVFASRFFFV